VPSESLGAASRDSDGDELGVKRGVDEEVTATCADD
jgi:hypothetical protein